MVTVMVVEDEPKIAAIARDYLERAGWKAVVAPTGGKALELYDAHHPSLVVLDLRLPDMDGLQVARAIRERGDAPIVMLTARAQEADRLVGFENGADDYITKPFSPRELVARVAAVLRRSKLVAPAGTPFQAGELTIQPSERRVMRNGAPIDLTPSEFDLLAALAGHPGRVFSRGQLLEVIGGDSGEAFDRAIDSHIKNLRRKVERDPRSPRWIKTVYGVGYKFTE